MQYLLVSILVIFAIGFFAVPGAAADHAAAGSGMSLSVDCSGSTCAINGQTDRIDQDVSIIVESSIGIQAVLQTDTSGGQFSTTIGVSGYPDDTYTIKANQGSSSKYTTSVSIDVSGGSSSSSDSVSNIVAASEEEHGHMEEMETTAADAEQTTLSASDLNAIESYLDRYDQLFTNYDEMSYPDVCCGWELTGALLWKEKLKPLVENADDPLESLAVIQTEHMNRKDAVRAINDQTTHYNPDGTETEMWAITWTMYQAQSYNNGYYVGSIIGNVNEGMSFQTAFDMADETADNWIEQLSSAQVAAEAAAADAAAAAAADAAAAAAADAAAAAAADAAAMAAVTDEIVIPDWIRTNAGWWADGLIDDRTFVSGLQWLITNGIMIIG